MAELKKNHGEIGEALQKRIGEVTDEFSLDKEDSALSRLVGRVESARSQITAEFTLDEEGSALSRMRRDLLEVMETQRKTNEQFQIEVMEKLAEMTARRKESERSTRHGEDFEVAVFDFVNGRAQKLATSHPVPGTPPASSGTTRKATSWWSWDPNMPRPARAS